MGTLIDLSSPIVKRRILVVLGLLALGWVLWTSRSALTPFFVGALFAYLLLPIVRFFDRVLPLRGRYYRFKRPISIVATYLLLFFVIAGIALYLIPPLVDQTGEFIDNLPDYWDAGRQQFERLNNLYTDLVPDSIQQQIEENFSSVGAQLSAAISSAMMATFSAVGTVVGFVAGLALLPLWLFYVLKDHERGVTRFYNMWPESWRGDVRNIVIIIDGVLGSYIRVQLFLGVIIGIVTGIALWIIGINQSLVLGLAAGFFELIPILGPWIAFIVAAIVTVATEPEKLPLVAIAFLGIQQLENSFLVPKLQGDAVRINPAIVMILLVIGGAIWGLVGMIVIIPMAAVLRDIFIYLYDRTSQDRPPDDPLESVKH